MREPFTLSGPDFLDSLAHNEQGDGRLSNAAEYSKRANEWRDDLQSASVARDANDLLSRELVNLRRRAAEAHDALSRIRPHSEHMDDYIVAREVLTAVADLKPHSPAWATIASVDRDPRLQPMPGDRFYLPVEVTFANYGPGRDFTATFSPLLDGQPFNQTFHVYATYSAWLQGAIGIVPAAESHPIPAAAAA